MAQGIHHDMAGDRRRPASPSLVGRTATRMGETVMPASYDDRVTVPARRSPARSAVPSSWAVRLGRLVPRLLLIAAVLLLALAIGFFAFRAVYADRVYPAVAVGDVWVGGMTADEAAATVQQRAQELEHGSIRFSHGGQTWTPSLSEIGAEIHADSSVDAAYALGRGDNAVTRLTFANELLRRDQHVPLRTTVDRDILESWFDSVDRDINQRAVDASLIVDGTDVTITPDRTGVIVDRDAATDAILATLTGLEPVDIELPTLVEQPNIYAADLEAHRADLAAALDGPIVARFEGQAWEIPPGDLARFLTVNVAWGGNDTDVVITLDRDSLSAYLRDGFSGLVNRAPVDATVAWNSEQGGLVSLTQSVNGAALRSNTFADAVAESFLGDQSMVDIPVVVTRPAVDSNNLAALSIDGLLARGDSNYERGNEDRDRNIEVGTELLNGELVAPGETFSFNAAVGEITEEKGFVEAGVIEAETIGRDVGGGICQLSTTVFRAALMAGMPITEWWPHSLRLQGYERDGWTAGFDASILQAGSDPSLWGDFRFTNDTDGYLLVQAWNDYPHNIVEIYGNDDGRTVDLTEPTFNVPDWEYDDKEVVDPDKPEGYMEQTQWPTTPYEAMYTRTVTYADGRVEGRQFYSGYQGSGNVWVVSPDMKGKSPVAENRDS